MRRPAPIDTVDRPVKTGLKRIGSRQEYVFLSPDRSPGPERPCGSIIGGRDANTGGRFVPNLNISRWKGEAWLNINHRETVIKDERARLAKGVLEITKGDLKHRWYPKGEDLEWELVWKTNPNPPQARTQSPPWCRVVFELDFPQGLRFFRQPEKHLFRGQRVPQNVQGSYAVYWNKRNGPYKTGKLCHIFRPEAIDAQGKRSWCRLQVEEAKKTMSVLINQAWLDHASYPVTLDPTYGYTGTPSTPSALAVGELTMAIPNSSLGADGYAQKIHYYGKKTGATSPDISMGIYDNSSPRARVDYNGTDTISDTSYGWRTQNLNLAVVSNARYGLALVCETGQFDVPYDVGATQDIRVWGSQSSPLPASLNDADTTGSYDDTFFVGAYLTYAGDWVAGGLNTVHNANIGRVNKVPRANIGSVNRLS